MNIIEQVPASAIAPADTFSEHIRQTASRAPDRFSGVFEDLTAFLEHVKAASDGAPWCEVVAPAPRNPWLAYGLGCAAIYGPRNDDEGETVLEEYVEGDLSIYRFPRRADALRAAQLWAAGII
jgi:hypothetical protein